MRLVFETEQFFAIDKPAGFFVHPPEASRFPVDKNKICLHVLREQLGREVFPIHRLDGPTSGLVLFAYDKSATRALSELFMSREVEKRYLAVVRGWLETSGEIAIPLEIKGFSGTNASLTRFNAVSKIEIAQAVGRYPTARYTLAEVRPVTGRWHQIRRHFDRVAHPLIGDIEHGDSYHNRFFRDELKLRGLCLRAKTLRFINPWTNEPVLIEAPTDAEDSTLWRGLFKLFGSGDEVC